MTRLWVINLLLFFYFTPCFATKTNNNTNFFILPEITVQAEKPSKHPTKKLLQKELKDLPIPLGDPVKALANLPGVSSFRSLDSSGIFIRGGADWENNYYFGQMGIPSLFHTGAAISMISPDLIDGVEFFFSGAPVSDEGCLGSAIHMIPKDLSDTKNLHGRIDANFFMPSVAFRGEIMPNLKFAVSFRTSIYQWIAPLIRSGDYKTLQDAGLLLEYKANEQNHIYLHLLNYYDWLNIPYIGEEYIPEAHDVYTNTNSYHWANIGGELSWKFKNNWIENKLSISFLFLNNSQLLRQYDFYTYLTQIGGKTHYKEIFETNYMGEKIKYPRFREEIIFHLSDFQNIRLGGEWKLTDYFSRNDSDIVYYGEKSLYDTNDEITNFIPYPSTGTNYQIKNHYLTNFYRIGLFAEWSFKFGSLQIVPALRYSYYEYHSYQVWSPQLMLKYTTIPKHLLFHVEIGKYAQIGKNTLSGEHQLAQYEEKGMFDTNSMYPEESLGINGGIKWELLKNWHLTCDLYYKQLSHLDLKNTNLNSYHYFLYQSLGKGENYGIEIMLRKQKDVINPFYGWVGYSYGSSQRQDVIDSPYSPFDYQILHSFKIFVAWSINTSWTISGTWSYASGFPYTRVIGATYNTNQWSYEPIFSTNHNSEQVPDNHYLDFKISYRFKMWRGKAKAYFGLLNAYNNNFYIWPAYNRDFSNADNPDFISYGIPIFPNVGFEWEF